MKTFYHSGSLGDMIYSLPTVQAMGGGIYVTGMSLKEHNSIAPLLRVQPCIREVYHVSEHGLPGDFVDLGKFRNHPLFSRIHIAKLHAETQHVEIAGWQAGWLNPRLSWQNTNQRSDTSYNYAALSVTPRYRDRFFNWDGELRYLFSKVDRIYFLGHPAEFAEFVNKKPSAIRKRVTFKPTKDLYEAAYYIMHAELFSGNQSSMLAIRQGFGMPYRFEQSPNHLDTEQGTSRETIINPFTRRLHLATICAKKALFDIKTKRFHA